jgi:hypothetical protein
MPSCGGFGIPFAPYEPSRQVRRNLGVSIRTDLSACRFVGVVVSLKERLRESVSTEFRFDEEEDVAATG